MYNKPAVERFGSFRELTQAGCTGSTDGASFMGIGSVGSTPTVHSGTTDYCFTAPTGSR